MEKQYYLLSVDQEHPGTKALLFDQERPDIQETSSTADYKRCRVGIP